MEDEHKRLKKDDPDLSDAITYLTRVKEEFKDEQFIYDRFLELMRDYKQGRGDSHRIVLAVEQLFKGKKYLIDGFETFLPKKSRDERMHERYVDRVGSRYNDRINDGYFGDMRMGERGGIDRMNDIRMNERHIHERYVHDRISDRPSLMDRPGNVNERIDRSLMTNERMSNPERGMIINDKELERHHMNERMGLERQSEKINERGQFDNKVNRIPRPEDQKAQSKALEFIQSVKKRFSDSSEIYREFIRYLQQYQKMPGNADIVLAKLRGLLVGNDDLLAEFADFLPQMRMRETTKYLDKNVQAKENQEESQLIRVVHEVLKKNDILEPFTKLLNMYNQGVVTGKEFIVLIEPILKNAELLKAFKVFIGYREIDAPPHMLRNLKTYKKINSYRILPDSYREAICQGQDGIAKSVLNTYCIACPEKDGSFISSPKNQSEEILFRVEDERYEFELQIMRISDLITNLEYLLMSFDNQKSKDEDKMDSSIILTLEDIDMPGGIVQEIFTEIYRDKAIDILEGILNHPQVTIPIVLTRLYTVIRKHKRKMKPKIRVWHEITQQNHYSAIDAQGFIFREDKKDFNGQVTQPENISCVMNDVDIISDIYDLYMTFISGLVESDTLDIANWVLNVLKKKDDVGFYSTPLIANVFKSFIVLYERLEEMKSYFNQEECKDKIQISDNINTEDDSHESNKDKPTNQNIAKKLDLLSDEEMLKHDKSCKTYTYMLSLIKDSLTGVINNSTFEDRLRIITDIRGYKLYSIEKLFVKLEKMIVSAKNDESSMNTVKISHKNIGKSVMEAVTDLEILYRISKEDGTLVINEQEVDNDENNSVIKDLVRHTVHDSCLQNEKVFLERSKQNEVNDVCIDFCLECNYDNNKLRYVEDTWDFLIKKGKKRTYKGN